MPEWYLVIIALGGLSLLALLWPKLVFALPLFLLAAGATIWQSILSSAEAVFPTRSLPRITKWKLHILTAFLHLCQPLSRLWGRVRHGLIAWRMHVPAVLFLPFGKKTTLWSEQWHAPESVLEQVTENLRKERAVLLVGGDFDRWDLEVRGGMLGSARVFMTTEEHGAGRQLFRFNYWPHFFWEAVVAVLIFTGLAVGAALDKFWLAYDILALIALFLLGRTILEAGAATGAIERAVKGALKEKP
jgi:hypothetical protein